MYAYMYVYRYVVSTTDAIFEVSETLYLQYGIGTVYFPKKERQTFWI